MKRLRRQRPLLFALYLNAALLAAVLCVVLGRSGGLPSFLPAAFASPLQPQPIAGGGSMYLMPAQFSDHVWGCYIMDIDAQTLCAYEFLTGEKQLRLVAARNFHWDRRLGNYNTQPPWPEVQKLGDMERQNLRVNEEPTSAPSPESSGGNK